MTQEVILADSPKLPVFQIAPPAIAARDLALNNSALIGKVENAAENDAAVKSQIELKRIATSFEKARKALKEPLLEAGRQLDRCVGTELADVDKEIGRMENLTRQFQLAEQRRVREEQEAQQRELERIEREKQAEIQRIAREQAVRDAEAQRVQDEIDRKAREEREAAAKSARDATNKQEREAAEKLLQEAAKREEANRIERERVAAESQARASEAMRVAAETAQAAAAIESKPITATRAAGQVIKTDWEITVLNPWELAKFHPDCVKIEPLMTPIKQALNAGITVKGIRAEKITKAQVRGGSPSFIEV